MLLTSYWSGEQQCGPRDHCYNKRVQSVVEVNQSEKDRFDDKEHQQRAFVVSYILSTRRRRKNVEQKNIKK